MIVDREDERGPFMAYTFADRREFLFDPEDETLVRPRKWRLRKLNSYHWYACTGGGLEMRLLHRLIMGSPDCDIDHRNGDSLNNRRHNLRLASVAQNAANKRNLGKRSATGYRGVYVWATGGYFAAITVRGNGGTKNLGRFDDPVEAARARDAAALEAWGEFAILNVPRDCR